MVAETKNRSLKKLKYKLSPNLIEQFRLLRDEDLPYITLQGVIDYIKGIKKYKFEMTFGNAVHHYLETGEVLKDDKPENGIAIIGAKDMLHPVEVDFLEFYRYKFKDFTFERWDRLYFDDTVLNLRTDGMEGYILNEIKTTTYYQGMDSYENSSQWKYYLMSSGCELARYHIFSYYKSKKRPFKLHYNTFEFHPYNGMEDEMNELRLNCIQFCKDQGIEKYILY